MPYPPPPGPPGVGEFQAIGKLPAPELPDVTGHSGEFLETDGIPQWEPVTGVLPDQTGHTGEFLTTDGANPSWAPASALPDQTSHGGEFLTTDGSVASWAPGAAGGVTTVGALTTATANAASITGSTLNLAPADQTNPGVLTTTMQDVGGLKLFHDGAASNVHDIRNYGAVSSPSSRDYTTATFDCSDAVEAAIAAFTQ